MKLNLSLLFLFFSMVTFGQKTMVSGILSDKEMNGEALPFANVVIKGTSMGATTDIEGKYAIEVPAGEHTIVFSFLGYESKEVKFSIAQGENKKINETLGTGSVTIEDVVIKATVSREKETALLLEQKKATEIKQSIGAQEMSRKGVSDVEEGLTKVTGITKVDGRGLFVRGLEDRYNNLLINDLQAPSNSPFKKIIPTDLFPTDIVGVLSVYKTFNPNISGDFAGATINIETSLPKNNITKISTGFSFTTQNNGEEFLISEDANSTRGFFGLNGNKKQLHPAFGQVPSSKSLTPNQYNEYNKNSNWNVDKSSSPINSSIGFLHANKLNVGDKKSLSYIISLNGDNSYQIRKGVDRIFAFGQGNYENDFFSSSYDYKTSASALASVKFKTERYSIGLNSFYLKSTSNKIEDQFGVYNNAVNQPNRIIRLNQLEDTKYWNNQVTGTYDITSDKKHTLKGGFSYTKTAFEQPDRKFLTGFLNGQNITTSFGGNSFIRQNLDISGDRFFSGLLEYNWIFKEKSNGKQNKLSLGYNGFSNEEVTSYRFVFGRPITSLPEFTTNINNIDSVINQNVENGLVRFIEESIEDYKSKLYQNVQSGYANLFLNFGDKLEINGGVRTEYALREIKFRTVGSTFQSPYKKYDETKVAILPSINAKYELNEKSNLRFASSKTITRPVSAELIPIQYVNGDNTITLGNYPLAQTINNAPSGWKSLKNSDNYNIDLKYEFFPEQSELLAVGIFSKHIKNPIERVLVASGNSGGRVVSYNNSQSANLYGIELESAINLKRLSPFLNKFTWGFNTSLMKTKVKVANLQGSGTENNVTRNLQGAAEWVVNSDLKYEFEFKEELKNTMTLVFGVTGDRIYTVGARGIDHEYEKPFPKLDFIWSSKLSKNIEAKISIDNILNPTFKRTLGENNSVAITETDLTLRSYKKGTGFGLNLSYTF